MLLGKPLNPQTDEVWQTLGAAVEVSAGTDPSGRWFRLPLRPEPFSCRVPTLLHGDAPATAASSAPSARPRGSPTPLRRAGAAGIRGAPGRDSVPELQSRGRSPVPGLSQASPGRPSRARCVLHCAGGGGRAGRVGDQCHDFFRGLEPPQSAAEGS